MLDLLGTYVAHIIPVHLDVLVLSWTYVSTFALFWGHLLEWWGHVVTVGHTPAGTTSIEVAPYGSPQSNSTGSFRCFVSRCQALPFRSSDPAPLYIVLCFPSAFFY